MRLVNGRTRALLGLVSGVVFATTSPPFDLHAGVLLGLAGFAFALNGAPRYRPGLLVGLAFGLGANLLALRFVPAVITSFTPLPLAAAYLALVLLAAGQAVPWVLGALLTQLLARRLPRVPAFLAFGIGVYVATFVPAIFPWTPAGGLTPWPALVQVADVVGERGVSLLVALASGLAAHGVFRYRAERAARALVAPLAAAAAILGLMLAYGAARMASVDRARDAAPHVTITLVNPGFEASERWDATRAAAMIERLTTLTHRAEDRGTDLTVWPESAYPFTLPHASRVGLPGRRAVLQAGVHGPVLTGAYLSGSKGLGYNSAILATSDGRLSAPYDKRHLLWFGETVPLADTFPWLREVFAKGTGLLPGHEPVVFTSGAIRASVLDCYEDTLPEAGREAMELLPNVLVNITNDAWFAGSAEGELHLRLAVLRAVETRRDLVRAVNKGPTSFVDAAGRVRARYDLDIPGTLVTSPALLETPPTAFVRFGDLPLLLLVLGTVSTAVVRARRARVA
ncbi:MAG: Apolipoprotein N-acyltransferase [Labilithrix sp.]|nr:Apolipoprotein N-acyltransferase [Labilithrix sp.]